MLTADSLWYSRRGERIAPRLVDPHDPDWLASARAFIDLARAHLGRTRGELESALRGAVPPKMHPKAARALARLVLDQCAFLAPDGVDPPRLREALCDAAALAWRTENTVNISADAAETGPHQDAEIGGNSWREVLLESVAGSLDLTRAEAEAALFADLSENQRLTALEPLTPESLLFRCNTAQVQGLLLSAERVWVTAPWPPPRRLRQLLRYVKFFGLLFSQDRVPARGGAPPMLSLTLDGPLSILASATRYGLQLAQFFPALLLWDEPWLLRAEVKPGRGMHGDIRGGMLEIERHPWLRSHYADRGMWVPEQVARFVESFNSATEKALAGKAGAGSTTAGNAKRPHWQVAPAEDVLMLPGNRALVPDFVFRRQETGATVYLEHLAYPVPERVTARLEQLKRAGRTDYLLACRGVPVIQALGVPCPPLIAYRRTLLPSTVRAALNALEGVGSGED